MMIKNAILLLDEFNLNISGGLGPYEATVQAAVFVTAPGCTCNSHHSAGCNASVAGCFLDFDGDDRSGETDTGYGADDSSYSPVLCHFLPGSILGGIMLLTEALFV
jgi:hypothetical protein